MQTPNGYTFKHTTRPDGRGGGVAIIFKSSLKFKNIERKAHESEIFDCLLQYSSNTLVPFSISPLFLLIQFSNVIAFV